MEQPTARFNTYFHGVLWPSAIVPLVVRGEDDYFRFEHSNEVIPMCRGDCDDEWNSKHANVHRMELEESVYGRGGYFLAFSNEDRCVPALHAIQREDILEKLFALYPIKEAKMRICIGTEARLRELQSTVFRIFLEASVFGANGPCPHRWKLAQAAIGLMQPVAMDQYAWAAEYQFESSAELRDLLAREYVSYKAMRIAFEGGAGLWSEERTDEEVRELAKTIVVELENLWPEVVRLYGTKSASPIL